MTRQDQETGAQNEFLREAEAGRMGLGAEFLDFLKHNKKWWLLPIVLVLAVIAGAMFLGGTAAAPFIYPLF